LIVYPCPDPRCKGSIITLTVPIVTMDDRGRRLVIWSLPCLQCIGSIASCNGAGSGNNSCNFPARIVDG
jgi:hypothetical protein